MKKTYRAIVTQDYSTGIWDNCTATIESQGRDGRFRIRYDHVCWENNSGSLRTRTVYLNRSSGRKLLKRYRQAIINDLKGNFGMTPLDVICGE